MLLLQPLTTGLENKIQIYAIKAQHSKSAPEMDNRRAANFLHCAVSEVAARNTIGSVQMHCHTPTTKQGRADQGEYITFRPCFVTRLRLICYVVHCDVSGSRCNITTTTTSNFSSHHKGNKPPLPPHPVPLKWSLSVTSSLASSSCKWPFFLCVLPLAVVCWLLAWRMHKTTNGLCVCLESQVHRIVVFSDHPPPRLRADITPLQTPHSPNHLVRSPLIFLLPLFSSSPNHNNNHNKNNNKKKKKIHKVENFAFFFFFF